MECCEMFVKYIVCNNIALQRMPKKYFGTHQSYVCNVKNVNRDSS